MIRIDNLTKSFGHYQAVKGLSFSVEPGEVLGFLGPNGAGKSTTMKMITGFFAPTSGAITLFGHNVQSEPLAAKSLIGYLPEGAPCYGDMTPRQYLAFIGRVRGFRGQELAQKVASVCEQLQLEAVIDKRIENLSKGFKRRVGLAQAIIHDPKVLILDEPTDGLDPNQKHEVRKLIANLSSDKIVIISTHILEEVSAVCSRAIIIAGGRILADGTPAELEARSKYQGAVTLRVAEGIEAVVAQLRTLENIADIEVKDQQATLFPKNQASIFEAISQQVQQHNWPVTELHVERGRLDEVFRDITLEVA